VEGFLIDDSDNINSDLDIKQKLLIMINTLIMNMILEIDPFYITFHFESL